MREPYITVREAAKLFHVSEGKLYRDLERNGPVKNGIVWALKFGSIWHCMPWNIARVMNGEVGDHDRNAA